MLVQRPKRYSAYASTDRNRIERFSTTPRLPQYDMRCEEEDVIVGDSYTARGLFETCIDSPIFNSSSASAKQWQEVIRSGTAQGTLPTLFRLFSIDLIVNIHPSLLHPKSLRRINRLLRNPRVTPIIPLEQIPPASVSSLVLVLIHAQPLRTALPHLAHIPHLLVVCHEAVAVVFGLKEARH
jgi:hypothetical protein